VRLGGGLYRLPALRTRRAKRDVSRERLFEPWRAEARALGFELSRADRRAKIRVSEVPLIPIGRTPSATQNNGGDRAKPRVPAALGKLVTAARTLDQHAHMPGVSVDLTQRERAARRGLPEHDRP
jgi:hypothetical protein